MYLLNKKFISSVSMMVTMTAHSETFTYCSQNQNLKDEAVGYRCLQNDAGILQKTGDNMWQTSDGLRWFLPNSNEYNYKDASDLCSFHRAHIPSRSEISLLNSRLYNGRTSSSVQLFNIKYTSSFQVWTSSPGERGFYYLWDIKSGETFYQSYFEHWYPAVCLSNHYSM